LERGAEVSARGVRAGKAFIEVGGDTSKMERALRRAQARLKAFGQSVRNIGIRVAAVGAGIVAAMLAAARSFAKAGDTIDKMSKRIGVGTDTLQELGFAAEQNGASLEVLEKGFAGLSRTFFEAKRGGAAANDALKEIGLTFRHLDGLSPDEQFMLIAEGLERVTDESIRGAVAQKIFGRAGRELVPMLRGAKGGIAALREEFKRTGVGMSEADIQAAVKLTDAWNLLRHAGKNIVNIIGASIAPTLTEAADRMTKIATAVGKWINRNRALVVGLLKVGTAVMVLGGALMLGGFALIGMAAGLAGVLAIIAALTTPTAALIASILALGATIYRMTQWGGASVRWLMARFGELRMYVGDVVQGMADALMSGDLQLAMRIMWLGAEVAFRSGTSTLLNIWEEFVHKVYSGWVELGNKLRNSDWWDNVRVAVGMTREHVNNDLPTRDTSKAEARAKELADAQRDLADAIGIAARQRADMPMPSMPGMPKLADFDFADMSARVVGTFNARAAQGLAGSPTEDRIAKATEETAKGIKQLNSRASSGGLVLTP
jgi:hypothetical protein